MAEETLLEFPCRFPIKVMGAATDDFRSLVLGIITRHFGEPAAGDI
jgi:putative lipoic acid-binding regulatory protein